MYRIRRPFTSPATGLTATVLAAIFPVIATAAPDIKALWEMPLADAHQARIYETVVVPGNEPRVIATTPDEVLVIEQGQWSTLFRLQHGAALGQSALLPALLTGKAATQGVIGVLSHNHHAVEGFELVDFSGSVFAKLDDPRHFHFRLAPDGSSFVGLDAGNDHTALAAAAVTYRFFDAQGRAGQGREIESPAPAASHDSAYAPDGKLFYVNSQRNGLTAYDPVAMTPAWSVEPAAMFASANSDTGLLFAATARKRNLAMLFERGQLRWAVSLADLGSNEMVRNVAISPNGQHIVVTGKTRLIVLGAASNEALGRFDAAEGEAINSLAVNDAGVVAVGVQSRDLQGGYVAFLDARSATPIRDSRPLRHRRSNAWIPTVQFDSSGRYLLARTLEQIDLYRIDDTAQPR